MLGRIGRATAAEHIEVEVEDENPEEDAETAEEAHPRLLGFTAPLYHLLVILEAGRWPLLLLRIHLTKRF